MTPTSKMLIIRERRLEEHGLVASRRSSADWLDCAIDAEKIAKRCGPFDPAFTIYTTNRDLYFEAAAIQEENGK
jgi:hypothetical protein